jgi:hypothetical protein
MICGIGIPAPRIILNPVACGSAASKFSTPERYIGFISSASWRILFRVAMARNAGSTSAAIANERMAATC